MGQLENKNWNLDWTNFIQLLNQELEYLTNKLLINYLYYILLLAIFFFFWKMVSCILNFLETVLDKTEKIIIKVQKDNQ